MSAKSSHWLEQHGERCRCDVNYLAGFFSSLWNQLEKAGAIEKSQTARTDSFLPASAEQRRKSMRIRTSEPRFLEIVEPLPRSPRVNITSEIVEDSAPCRSSSLRNGDEVRSTAPYYPRSLSVAPGRCAFLFSHGN